MKCSHNTVLNLINSVSTQKCIEMDIEIGQKVRDEGER